MRFDIATILPAIDKTHNPDLRAKVGVCFVEMVLDRHALARSRLGLTHAYQRMAIPGYRHGTRLRPGGAGTRSERWLCPAHSDNGGGSGLQSVSPIK